MFITTHQPPASFEMPRDSVTERVYQPFQRGVRRRGDSVKTRACFRGAVDTVQKQDVEVKVEIECTTKALNQRHRAGLCDITRKPAS